MILFKYLCQYLDSTDHIFCFIKNITINIYYLQRKSIGNGKKTFLLYYIHVAQGQIQGEDAEGVHPPEMKPSLYLLLKFVYLTSQLHHFLVVQPLLRKILDSPLQHQFFYTSTSTITILTVDNSFLLQCNKIFTSVVFSFCTNIKSTLKSGINSWKLYWQTNMEGQEASTLQYKKVNKENYNSSGLVRLRSSTRLFDFIVYNFKVS